MNIISYATIHRHIRNRMQKPDFCLCCGRKAKLRLASIGHTYTENVRDWIYLCEVCHSILDSKIDSSINGRIKTIIFKTSKEKLLCDDP